MLLKVWVRRDPVHEQECFVRVKAERPHHVIMFAHLRKQVLQFFYLPQGSMDQKWGHHIRSWGPIAQVRGMRIEHWGPRGQSFTTTTHTWLHKAVWLVAVLGLKYQSAVYFVIFFQRVLCPTVLTLILFTTGLELVLWTFLLNNNSAKNCFVWFPQETHRIDCAKDWELLQRYRNVTWRFCTCAPGGWYKSTSQLMCVFETPRCHCHLLLSLYFCPKETPSNWCLQWTHVSLAG